MLRTHTCGELSIKDVDKEVTLCGWVARRRDHGKLIFIDIRDRYGVTQGVFIPKECPADIYKKAEQLRSEFVVKLKGKVNKRPAGTVNSKLSTGEIEILVNSLEILNPSLNPPFEITEDLKISEEVRFKYRYLDLRRIKVFNNLLLRNNLYKIIRNYLEAQNFIECETPILTKSTPEGARDYLVPSRLNPGQFYALPQSPQLFKQILMVSGIEKYYQIAKCFRDEDLRADRQPEFTQLDLEMSFIDEEDIYFLIEALMFRIFKELKGMELKIPFPRITFAKAKNKYNTDKPDMRRDLNTEFAFAWVVDFPLFNYNEEEKRWESEHHPFTAVAQADLNELESAPGKVKSRSYDLVLNGIELGSGSIRIHDQNLQKKIFKIIGISQEEAQNRFGFLLEAFQFGAPPHGGFAFGIDRLLTILAGESSIREVITFPKTSAGICPLTNAPSGVDEKQLRELNLTVKRSRPKAAG
ncbi:MAG: aspartate--tRNA ligase [Candidatus Omnitrophica bacterium CG08_land_8_20_14_0_20_41_16]|uniref:Aspartate--tRNA(Asp/Asn) ligase n=1 Tax=Candidatus Sherwoodlollariibacterium unditelluris TaxID=1974757 RepID=A0A2G9YIU1_9BACT|nr:MAG: aspartate--tRNA ligase [Candidatus Omnitrophica bacterium CG23_combo_of_CG06-09_8_20_14_all_41_10]PIS33987.1 MAG: aspartate--tRNA ligase [Candidatus Omnitrophica bacterium CG08_land_8_20_14_0_20_41_16]